MSVFDDLATKFKGLNTDLSERLKFDSPEADLPFTDYVKKARPQQAGVTSNALPPALTGAAPSPPPPPPAASPTPQPFGAKVAPYTPKVDEAKKKAQAWVSDYMKSKGFSPNDVAQSLAGGNPQRGIGPWESYGQQASKEGWTPEKGAAEAGKQARIFSTPGIQEKVPVVNKALQTAARKVGQGVGGVASLKGVPYAPRVGEVVGEVGAGMFEPRTADELANEPAWAQMLNAAPMGIGEQALVDDAIRAIFQPRLTATALAQGPKAYARTALETTGPAMGIPKQELRTAGMSVRLPQELGSGRIKKFNVTELQSSFDSLKNRVESLGVDIDAYAGNNPQEYMIILERPKKSSVAYEGVQKAQTRPSDKFTEWATQGGGADNRDQLVFRNIDEAQAFVEQGQWQTFQRQSRVSTATTEEPLYKTSGGTWSPKAVPPTSEAEVLRRYFEPTSQVFDRLPSASKKNLLAAANVTEQAATPFMELPVEDRLRLLKVMEGPRAQEFGVQAQREAIIAEQRQAHIAALKTELVSEKKSVADYEHAIKTDSGVGADFAAKYLQDHKLRVSNIEAELRGLEGRPAIPTAAASAKKKPPAPSVAPAAKEPWQMTRAEFVGPQPVVLEGNTSTITRRFGKVGPTPEQLKEFNAITAARSKSLKAYKAYVERSNEHIFSTRKALSEGKPVPAEVLADYPDLAAKVPAKPPTEAAPPVTSAMPSPVPPKAGLTPEQQAERAAAPWRKGPFPQGPPQPRPAPDVTVSPVEAPKAAPGAGQAAEPDPEDVVAKFARVLQGDDQRSAWDLTQQLRARERAKRASALTARYGELVDRGILREDAMKQATQELAGPLPTASTELPQLFAEDVTERLFAKVDDVLKAEPYEQLSTHEALTNALAGHPIPREPGAKGGSAYTRLLRVFGDNPDMMKFLEDQRPLREKIKRVVDRAYPPTKPDFRPVDLNVPSAKAAVQPTMGQEAWNPAAQLAPEGQSELWSDVPFLGGKDAETGQRLPGFGVATSPWIDVTRPGAPPIAPEIEKAFAESRAATRAAELAKKQASDAYWAEKIQGPDAWPAPLSEGQQSLLKPQFGEGQVVGGTLMPSEDALKRLFLDPNDPNGASILEYMNKAKSEAAAKVEARRLEWETWKKTLGETGTDAGAHQLYLIPPPEGNRLVAALREAGLTTRDIGNLMRANLASADMSWWRQQAMLMPLHPSKSLRGNIEGFKGMFIKGYAEAAEQAIKRDPDYLIYDKLADKGLDFLRPATVDPKAPGWRGVEEFGFAGGERPIPKFTAKIPWVKYSQRGFVTAINDFNWSLFKDYLKMLREEELKVASGAVKLKPGEVFSVEKNLEALAKMMSDMTGRASVGSAQGNLRQITNVMNNGFFSLRTNLGRFLTPRHLVSTNPYVRKEAWKHLGAFIGTIGGVLIGGERLGLWEVEKDPRSADFMKARIGGLRIDPWGGYQQFVRFYSQIVTRGGINTETGAKFAVDPIEASTRLLRSKTSPLAGVIADFSTGRTFLGDKVDVGDAKYWADHVVPFMPMSIYEAWQEEGPAAAMAAAIPSAMGMGTASYGPSYKEELKGYWAIPTNEDERKAKYAAAKTPEERKLYSLSRNDYRSRNPDVEAILFITGQVSTLSTPAAKQKALGIINERGLDLAGIKGLQPGKFEKATDTSATLRRWFQAQLGVQPTSSPSQDAPVRPQVPTQSSGPSIEAQRRAAERLQTVGAR